MGVTGWEKEREKENAEKGKGLIEEQDLGAER